MPLFSDEKNSFLFIHVPKTGGASVEHFFRGFFSISLFSTNLHKNNTPFRCSPQHFHAEILTEILSEKFFNNSFAVVRHPTARLVSEYKYRMNERVSNGRSILSFSDFFEKCVDDFLRNPYVLDNHIRPQSDFILNNTRVYKFEEGLQSAVENELALLCKKVPVINLPHVNNAKNKSFINNFDITEADKDKIYEFYKDDFSNFGYCL